MTDGSNVPDILGRWMVAHICGQTLREVCHDSMANARLLGGLAALLIDTGDMSQANPQQLLEAALRTMEAVDMMIAATFPQQDDDAQERWDSSQLKTDIMEINAALDRLKKSMVESN